MHPVLPDLLINLSYGFRICGKITVLLFHFNLHYLLRLLYQQALLISAQLLSMVNYIYYTLFPRIRQMKILLHALRHRDFSLMIDEQCFCIVFFQKLLPFLLS